VDRRRGIQRQTAILEVVAEKARGGDLMAARIILDRVYPVRDATTAELFDEIEELRALIAKDKEKAGERPKSEG